MTAKPLNETNDVAALGELAAVLTEHGALLCAPEVSIDEDGYVTLTVRVSPVHQSTVGGALDAVELYNQLRYVVDVGQLRALAARYDIDPAKLEALLRQREEAS